MSVSGVRIAWPMLLTNRVFAALAASVAAWAWRRSLMSVTPAIRQERPPYCKLCADTRPQNSLPSARRKRTSWSLTRPSRRRASLKPWPSTLWAPYRLVIDKPTSCCG